MHPSAVSWALGVGVVVLGLCGWGGVSGAGTAQLNDQQLAQVACGNAIASDKPVTSTTIKECLAGNSGVPSGERRCSSGALVYEFALPLPDDTWLRLGHRPEVFGSSGFVVAVPYQLCGDRVPARLLGLPESSRLTPSQVRAAVRAARPTPVTADTTPVSVPPYCANGSTPGAPVLRIVATGRPGVSYDKASWAVTDIHDGLWVCLRDEDWGRWPQVQFWLQPQTTATQVATMAAELRQTGDFSSVTIEPG